MNGIAFPKKKKKKSFLIFFIYYWFFSIGARHWGLNSFSVKFSEHREVSLLIDFVSDD